MYSVEQLSYDEKVKAYSKLSKKELIAILLENQRILSNIQPQVVFPYPYQPYEPCAPLGPYYYGTPPMNPYCTEPYNICMS